MKSDGEPNIPWGRELLVLSVCPPADPKTDAVDRAGGHPRLSEGDPAQGTGLHRRGTEAGLSSRREFLSGSSTVLSESVF